MVEGSNTGRVRFLAVLHIVVGIVLLPLSSFFGFVLIPIMAIVPVWLIVLGVKLWRPSDITHLLLKRTSIVCMFIGVIMAAYGIYCLEMARRSAEGGGGLMGAFGAVPILYGVLLGIASALSLGIERKLR
jgi:hypothetical protein